MIIQLISLNCSTRVQIIFEWKIVVHYFFPRNVLDEVFALARENAHRAYLHKSDYNAGHTSIL